MSEEPNRHSLQVSEVVEAITRIGEGNAGRLLGCPEWHYGSTTIDSVLYGISEYDSSTDRYTRTECVFMAAVAAMRASIDGIER